MSAEDLCLTCGACCATFRVSFYWGEAETELGGVVPIALTEKLNDFRRVMRGTNQPRPRCIALDGQVGHCVTCTIYPNRPTPCRDFPVSWSNGTANEECDKARSAWGLPPITLDMVQDTIGAREKV